MNLRQIFLLLFVLAGIATITYQLGKSSSRTVTTKVTKAFETEYSNETNIKILSYNPRILQYDNFLTSEECDYIINLGGSKVERSKVVGQNGKGVVSDVRTSSGTFLSKYMKDPVVKSIANRIAKWTFLPEENGEVFYLLRYNLGEEYKPHPDYFSRESHGNLISQRGQRVATVLTYLSDVEGGGETVFPRLNLSVSPKKGRAILFWNVNTDGVEDPMTIHGSNPVTKGTKWAMTRWIRDKSQK